MTRPVVLTGGGTGGHIFPMQAIAEALVAEGVAEADIRYVGSRRGQEANLLGGGPFALTLLPGRGLRRSLSLGALRDNASALLALAGALAQAVVLVGRWRPRVVISVGGYAAAAVCTATVLWRRPLVLVDLDATPSATHRALARFATTRCVALGHAGEHVYVTGAPVRAHVRELDRAPTERRRAKLALLDPIEPERRVVVVMTGSLGATRVNQAVLELARLWRDREDRTLVHITGRRDFEIITSAPLEHGVLDYRVLDFADMGTWWAVADVAICRSGALTVAELTTLGLPAVLVPLPGAPGDHQTHNARALCEVGAAVMLRDEECNGETLARAVESILEPERCAEMSRSSLQLARPEAARDIARVALSLRGES